MIVVDASAVVELVLRTEIGRRFEVLLEDESLTLHAPHGFDLEVVSALRRIARQSRAHAERCESAFLRLQEVLVERWPPAPMLPRVWELRDRLTAYDAAYVVLAQALGCELITTDGRLSRAPRLPIQVRVI